MMKEIQPVQRLLLGPGPSEVDPRVIRAMATPLVGHLDPQFLEVMDETMEGLRYVLETDESLAFPVSGTGSAGMEAALANVLEPGDPFLVLQNGLFGQRMVEVARRLDAVVETVETDWGTAVPFDRVEKALKRGPSLAETAQFKAVGIVHAETSTGVLQPALDQLAALVHDYRALLVVDAVTSLGGTRVGVDRCQLDVVYSGTQKCLSAPPGLAPLMLNGRARQLLANRKSPVRSWYLDVSMIEKYWGDERFYHHTAPISSVYALHEALRIIQEEGLETRFERHRRHADALVAALPALGLEPFVAAEIRTPMLVTVSVPSDIDEEQVRKYLLEQCNIEIGGGLGPLSGRIWRIGLMGHGSRWQNLVRLIQGLAMALAAQGKTVSTLEALKRAETVVND